jgi:translation initiation factor IF-3
MNKNKKQHKLNREITATQVRVSDEGVMSLHEALALAEAKEMDLVLLNEVPNPPICKIMKYEKFIYEQNKKPKKKVLDVKEIKLGPNTAENDLEYRAKHMVEFLKKGHKVKLTIQFRGREMAYVDRGKELLLKLILSVEEFGVAESMPNMEGKKMMVNVRPKK